MGCANNLVRGAASPCLSWGKKKETASVSVEYIKHFSGHKKDTLPWAWLKGERLSMILTACTVVGGYPCVLPRGTSSNPVVLRLCRCLWSEGDLFSKRGTSLSPGTQGQGNMESWSTMTTCAQVAQQEHRQILGPAWLFLSEKQSNSQ